MWILCGWQTMEAAVWETPRVLLAAVSDYQGRLRECRNKIVQRMSTVCAGFDASSPCGCSECALQ